MRRGRDRNTRSILRGALLLLLGSVLSGCMVVPEGETYGPRAGDTLLALSASYSSLDANDDARTQSVDAEAGIGVSQFLTDRHEIGVLAQTRRLELEVGNNDTDATIYSVSPFYNFNFRSGDRTLFYAGPHVGLRLQDIGGEDDTSLSYGAHVGFRHFLSPSVALFAEPRYTRFEFDDDDAAEFSVLFGLQYRF